MLPALTTTTNLLHVPSNPGVVEGFASRGKPRGEHRASASSLTLPRHLLHVRIECQQPEPVEDFGCYTVRVATRNRTQNKVKVQSRERISDGQALFGRQGPLFSIPRPPVLKINTIDAANHAGAGSSSTTAGMNQVKKMTKATKVRR